MCERIFATIQTFSWIVPTWVRKTKLVRTISKILVNHLGLALTKEDLQNVVDLMEPYGQISDGIELMNPPRDVSILSILLGQLALFEL